MSDWQPIETAPKDGESVLVFTDAGMYLASWVGSGWYNGDVVLDQMGLVVTHWMPLPSPPAV